MIHHIVQFALRQRLLVLLLVLLLLPLDPIRPSSPRP